MIIMPWRSISYEYDGWSLRWGRFPVIGALEASLLKRGADVNTRVIHVHVQIHAQRYLITSAHRYKETFLSCKHQHKITETYAITFAYDCICVYVHVYTCILTTYNYIPIYIYIYTCRYIHILANPGEPLQIIHISIYIYIFVCIYI